MKNLSFITKEESLVKIDLLEIMKLKSDIFIMICTISSVIVTEKRVLKIAHLNAGLSNKRLRRLLLSYIKRPGV